MLNFIFVKGFRCMLLACCLIVSAVANSSENGQVHYPTGVNTIMSGTLPSPGETMFYNYFQYYHSTRLNDGNGKSLDPNFRVSVMAWAPRVVHTWNQQIGPFYLASSFLMPITRVDIEAFGRREISSGIGDPALTPFYLYYVNANGTFFAYAGPDIYLPLGRYDKNRLANNGLHYWAVAPSVNLTWMPAPRWEVSSTIYSEFNFKNSATDYRSGNSVTLDFNLAYRPIENLPKLRVALQGFALKQFTVDRQNDAEVSGGNRAQAFGFGPQLSYDIAGGKGALLLKFQKEFSVENRSQGDRFWFEVAFPL